MTACIMLLHLLVAVLGCEAVALLLSSGPFEKKHQPAYNLREQQNRKVLIWVECPQSARADYDLPEKLALAFQLYMTEKAKFDSENIILNPISDGSELILNPIKVARSQGAGYVLLVHVDHYESDFLQIRNYYSGELITRAVLFDAETKSQVWPTQPAGEMVHISVEMETQGRSALLSRLVSASVHCTMRYLYPCDKLKYKHGDERISTQEVFEFETY